jgi:hypothetical protein
MTKATNDRLLAALIAKLPADAAPWPCGGRIAWLQLMAMAFDVVYGPCGNIRVAPGEAHGEHEGAGGIAPSHGQAEYRGTLRPGLAKRFYVDRDGFAMGDGRPVAMDELPADAILWDERTGIECGDASAILWRDTGTSRERLPPGVMLRPVFDES